MIIGVTNQTKIEDDKSLWTCIKEQQESIKLSPCLFKIYFYEDRKIDYRFSDGEKILNLKLSNLGTDIIDLPSSELSSSHKIESKILEFIFNNNIDIQNSIYVGDCQEDRDFVKNINCSFLWAEQWRSLFGE